MSAEDSGGRERLRRLMMAALDGEIDREEQRELDLALEADAEASEEWKQMSQVKQLTSTMCFREPPEEVWPRYWTSVYRKFERGVGWILVSVGAILLVGYGVWELVQELLGDTSVPVAVRVAIAAVGIGAVVLFISVAREKLFAWRRDPYREIER